VRQSVLSAGLVVGAFLAGACGDDGTGPKESIEDFVTAVSVAGGTVKLVRGGPPGAAAGPQAVADAPASVITGGTALVELASGQAFGEAVLYIESRSDYYRVTLASPATSVTLQVTFGAELPSTLALSYAVGSGGTFGTPVVTPLSVIQVGTGTVQISVSWDSPADVDLHVVEPSGEEIFYANGISATGGVLDLDSNAGCSSDGPRNENITWPESAPPRGLYIVRVNHWSECGATSTHWVVTVRVKGRAPTVHTGTFTGAGNHGGLGDGVVVTSFQY
jgi:hypothetical protein